MQAVARQVEFLRCRRVIEDGQYFLNCIREISPYSATIVALVQALKATMLKTPDHQCKVYIVTCQMKIAKSQIFLGFLRLGWLRVWLPRVRIRRGGGVYVEVPDVEVHAFVALRFNQDVFAGGQVFGGS